jgi:L-seryl-tRNA(Ser) seleniumtransferase
MMEPGDAEIVAERMVQLLANPPRMRQPEEVLGAPARIAGHWDVKIDFMLGSSSHKLLLEQSGGKVTGTHLGRTVSGDLRGRVEGDRVVLRSLQLYEGARLHFTFSGTAQRDTMGGTVDLGEYGEAEWKAHRHQYRS